MEGESVVATSWYLLQTRAYIILFQRAAEVYYYFIIFYS